MKKLLLFAFVFALAAGAQDSPPAKIAGKWQMSMETPHGVVKGPFDIEQDGARSSPSRSQTEMFGKTLRHRVGGREQGVVQPDRAERAAGLRIFGHGGWLEDERHDGNGRGVVGHSRQRAGGREVDPRDGEPIFG